MNYVGVCFERENFQEKGLYFVDSTTEALVKCIFLSHEVGGKNCEIQFLPLV